MRSSDDIPTEIALSYLVVLQDGAVRATQTAGRLFVFMLTLTAVTLCLAVGVIDPTNELAFSGANFDVDSWVLMIAGSVLAFTMLLLHAAYVARSERLAWRAVTLYDALAFDLPKQEWLTGDSPFGIEYATAAVESLDRLPLLEWLRYRHVAFLASSIATFTLVVTQCLVLGQLVDGFGWTVPVVMFAVIPTLTTAVGIARMVSARSQFGRGLVLPWR